MEAGTASGYPVEFSVDYPNRQLNRLTTAFRLIVAIPILIVFIASSRLLVRGVLAGSVKS